jgi:3-oxoadipate enol-lactonase
MGESDESAGECPGPAGRIAWRRIGSGPSLLLINGYAASGADWDPSFLEILAGSSTVICPDNRGIGGSELRDGELSIDAMADDCFALIDSMGIESTAVAGWSMGGFIAQAVAAREPDRIESLVLLSTDPGGELAEQRDPEVQRRLFDHSGTPHEQAARLLDLLFPARMAKEIYEQFGDIVAEAQAKLDPATLVAQQKAMGAWNESAAIERLASITAPTLIAAGTADVVIPAANSELISDLLPDSWLVRFPGAGHAVMAQEAARLGGLINIFLGRT